MKRRIAPSLLAADFGKFAEAAEQCAAAGAEVLHFDVMDGLFVPNISYGAPLVRALRPHSSLVFDVHLMIVDPERYIAEFAAAGADLITVHAEATRHLQRALQLVRSSGCRAGLALNPATPLTVLDYVWPDIDQLLIMTVNPGFGGQAFIPQTLHKVRDARVLADRTGRQIDLQVDGGVGPENAAELSAAGATVFVAGTSIFGHSAGVAGGIAAMRAALG
jgi:ribulose-phosphate 3-epimerase